MFLFTFKYVLCETDQCGLQAEQSAAAHYFIKTLDNIRKG